MKRIWCYENRPRWDHPMLQEALCHPELEFQWSKEPLLGAAAAIVHSIVDQPGIPSVFHLEECRSTWWAQGHEEPLGTMPGVDFLRMIGSKLAQYDRIITHVPETIDVLGNLYGPEVQRKARLVPIGVSGTFESEPPRKEDRFRFLFTNSYHGDFTNFYRRGGLEAITAFRRIRSRYDCELVLAVPGYGEPHDKDIFVLNDRLSNAQMEMLFRSAHCFLLPSIDLHTHSILRAQINGCVPITTAVPGAYHFAAGIPILGREKDFWMDPSGQWLSTPKAVFREELVGHLEAAMEELVKHPEQTIEMGKQIADHTRSSFPISGWRDGVCNALLEVAR